jgi:hypothetical protein
MKLPSIEFNARLQILSRSFCDIAQVCNNRKDAFFWLFSHRPAQRAAPTIAMEERDFFDERPEKKLATLNCPHCHQPAEYEVTWLVRTKKRQLGGRADERDRARFAKARSYMIRKDDMMGCKNVRCRKRFEISSLQSVVFTE